MGEVFDLIFCKVLRVLVCLVWLDVLMIIFFNNVLVMVGLSEVVDEMELMISLFVSLCLRNGMNYFKKYSFLFGLVLGIVGVWLLFDFGIFLVSKVFFVLFFLVEGKIFDRNNEWRNVCVWLL